MEFRILGPLEVRHERGPVVLGGIKPRAVLTVLLLHPNESVHPERLALALWGEEAPASAAKTVRVYVSRLRKALGDPETLATTPAGYRLRVRADELDAERFARLVEDGRRALATGQAEHAAAVLREALALWRGPALADLAFEPFAQAEIARLEEQRLAALEARVDADLAAGRHAELVGELRQLVAANPTRERLAGQLMLALYRCGQQADALEAFQAARRVLVDQLGVEPGPKLRELQHAVFAHDPRLDAPPTMVRLEPATAPTAHATPLPTSPRGLRVRFRLPLAAAHFTGRDAELDAIEAAFGVAERAVVMQAITGLGGVGKSQLAARYVHEHAHDYDIVAWIRAEDGGIADLSEFAAALGLPVAQLTPVKRAGRALRWLSGCEERWLLVLDNVAAPEQLDDCCPAVGNGRVIVTTRDRAMTQFAPALTVDVFDEQTAIEYLLAASGRTRDRAGATQVAQALGFLPLALSHAGAYCAAGTSFDDYLELLGTLPAAELFDDHPEVSYAQTVASTWQVSIDAAERQAPLARRVLAMAAYLAPDAIPRELFDVLLDDASSAAARKHLLDAFNALHRLSLIEVDDTVVNIHRLLQKTIRDDPAVGADQTAVVSALAAVAAAFPRELHQPQTWRECERLLPHALAVADALTTPAETGQQLVELLISASEYLLRADPRARAVDTATRAFACARQFVGPDHPDTLRAGTFLAASYGYTGRTSESIELVERMLADYERTVGLAHPDALQAAGMTLLGSYWDAGRTTEAIRLGERVLPDCERILGPEHPDTLFVCSLLVACYWDAGRATEAIELGERTHAACERTLGPEHPQTLIARAFLALGWADAGRGAEAIELGERAFADCERILGPEHAHTLHAGHALASTYAAAGRTDQGIEQGQRVLADCERILGPKHLTTVRARITLAVIYQWAGRMTEAIELGEPVLADREQPQLLSEKHRYTLGIHAILTAAHARAGRTNAIELLERLLADSERTLGPKHPATQSIRGELAAVYHKTERSADLLKREGTDLARSGDQAQDEDDA